MKRCEYLEQVSDKIRRGETVGLREAVAAIDYQGRLRAERDAVRASKWWRRAWSYLTRRIPAQPEREAGE